MREEKKRVRDSQRQENEGMQRLGGTRNVASGSLWWRKGDGRVNGVSWTDPDHALVEFKRTDKRQITLKADDLEKVTNEAIAEGRVAVLGVSVGGRDYVVMEAGDYEELLDTIRSLMREFGDDDRRHMDGAG